MFLILCDHAIRTTSSVFAGFCMVQVMVWVTEPTSKQVESMIHRPKFGLIFGVKTIDFQGAEGRAIYRLSVGFQEPSLSIFRLKRTIFPSLKGQMCLETAWKESFIISHWALKTFLHFKATCSTFFYLKPFASNWDAGNEDPLGDMMSLSIED